MELLLRPEETMDIIRSKDEYTTDWFLNHFFVHSNDYDCKYIYSQLSQNVQEQINAEDKKLCDRLDAIIEDSQKVRRESEEARRESEEARRETRALIEHADEMIEDTKRVVENSRKFREEGQKRMEELDKRLAMYQQINKILDQNLENVRNHRIQLGLPDPEPMTPEEEAEFLESLGLSGIF
jgi:DNA repair exonuclease SbcCD ATPase subunit